jgi:uncharacterized membrane protein YhaH (DUF805 family)
MHWYIESLGKYIVFRGRASKAEFWYFQLFNALVPLAISLVIQFAYGASHGAAGKAALALPLSPLVHTWIRLYSLVFYLPSIAVTVRRLHDTGRSGWWFLICLVPVIGWYVELVFLLEDSQPWENRFGPIPQVAVRTSGDY